MPCVAKAAAAEFAEVAIELGRDCGRNALPPELLPRGWNAATLPCLDWEKAPGGPTAGLYANSSCAGVMP